MRRGVWASLVACAVSGVLLAGCSAGSPAGSGQAGQSEAPAATASAEPSEDAIKIDEIEWEVKEGVVDGDREVVFSYTNNSQYTLMGVEFRFEQRDDVRDKDRSVFDELYAENESWEENNGGPDEVYVSTWTNKLTDPGETVDLVPCTLNNTYTPVGSIEQFELMEPSIATIAYVFNGKKYVEYYDYQNESYSLDSRSGTSADEWEGAVETKLVPKPASDVITVSINDYGILSAEAFGIDRAVFEAYVEDCKNNGFTQDVNEDDDLYWAQTEDGDDLKLSFDANDECLGVNLTIAD